jgi:hypothetical protein
MRSFATLVAFFCASGCGSTLQGASPSPDGGGSGQGGALDCAWSRSSNCWKSAVASASSCLPPPAAQGTISADGTTCTYASGTVITFQPPLLGNLGYVALSRFQTTTGGSGCLSYALNDAGTGSSITTPAGTITLAVDKSKESLTLTCPDGTSYVADGPDAEAELSTCPEGAPGFDVASGGAGSADGGSHQNMTVTLTDTDSDGGTRVFDCTN